MYINIYPNRSNSYIEPIEKLTSLFYDTFNFHSDEYPVFFMKILDFFLLLKILLHDMIISMYLQY